MRTHGPLRIRSTQECTSFLMRCSELAWAPGSSICPWKCLWLLALSLICSRSWKHYLASHSNLLEMFLFDIVVRGRLRRQRPFRRIQIAGFSLMGSRRCIHRRSCRLSWPLCAHGERATAKSPETWRCQSRVSCCWKSAIITSSLVVTLTTRCISSHQDSRTIAVQLYTVRDR